LPATAECDRTKLSMTVIEFETLDSTNQYAREHFKDLDDATVICARTQTAGRGRLGRVWQSPHDVNIYATMVMKHLESGFHAGCIAGLAGIATLREFAPEINFFLKWPNDIYWRDRKTGGILLETSLLGNKWQWTIAGIGININQTHFPDLSKKAVSLKQITGKTHDPALLAKELCGCIDQRYRALKKEGFAPLLEAYRERLHKKGEWVRLKKNNTIGKYLIQSVSEQGDLVVEAGMEYVFAHGSVKWIG